MSLPGPSSTDRELFAAQSSDAQAESAAFTEFVRRYRDTAWRVALRMVEDPEVAAEAVQDAFLTTWRTRATLPPDVKVSTWFYPILANSVRQRYRAERRRRAEFVLPPAELPEVPAPDDISRLELQLDIHVALAELPPRQRAAVSLVDVQSFTVTDSIS